jgi:hypothetical protein
MAFFFIIGTRFFTWGSQPTPQPMQCGRCGTLSYFKQKSGMRFITLFFIVPVIPISGVSQLAECPTCKARYRVS